MAHDAHPPLPGPIVRPNLLPLMEALAAVEFPITKDRLMSEVEDLTVMIAGRTVDLRDIIREVHDDAFATEDELATALENIYARPEGASMEGWSQPTARSRAWDILEP